MFISFMKGSGIDQNMIVSDFDDNLHKSSVKQVITKTICFGPITYDCYGNIAIIYSEESRYWD